MQTEICIWFPPSARVKKIAYGVKFTHVSKSIDMRQFVSKFEYTQINTHVSKSVRVYRALVSYLPLVFMCVLLAFFLMNVRHREVECLNPGLHLPLLPVLLFSVPT